jgi:hypothetical protein
MYAVHDYQKKHWNVIQEDSGYWDYLKSDVAD